MIYGILPLLSLGGIVALVVRAIGGRTGEGGGERSTTSLRRFFQYAVMLGVLIVVAMGLVGLVEEVLPRTGDLLRRDRSAIARSLAFVLVGIPVYWGLATWVRRLLGHTAERNSFGWSFYLTASLLASLAVTGFAAFELLSVLFGAEDYDPGTVALFLVWGAVWAGHWIVASRYLGNERGQVHLVIGSAAGLLSLAGAVGAALLIGLSALYGNLFQAELVTDIGNDAARAGAGAIVGGAVWWLYWLQHTIGRSQTRLWRGYVLFFGVLGGLLTAVGAATSLLYTILEWWFGDPRAATATAQFDVLPAIVASGLIGVGLFYYHRAVLGERVGEERSELRRLYEYLIAGVGLLGFAGGITVLLVALIQQLAPGGRVVAGDSEVNTLMGAVTFLVVGGPIWGTSWSGIQRIRAADPEDELRSPSRRGYLAVLFGIGGVTALISLVVVVFAVLEDIFEGRFGGRTISDVAPAIALVMTTGVVAGYHWQVFAEDREQAPAALRSPLREVIMVGVEANGLAARLEGQLDVRVREWERLDGPGSAVDATEIIAQLAEETHERVILMGGEDGPRIVPFAPRK